MTVLIADRRFSRAPDRSHEQRLQALERANEVRAWRAGLKEQIKAERVDPVAVLLADPLDERLASMRIFDLLLAVPKLGRVKVDRALKRLGISPSKTVAGLSRRQRGEIVLLLRAHAGRRRRTQPPRSVVGVRAGSPTSEDSGAMTTQGR